MAKDHPQQDPEDVRTDLMATMAASRELGPEMDKALADSYMEKHHPVSAQQPAQQQVTQPQERSQSADVIGFAGVAIGIVAFIALLAVSHGALWWLFWPVMGWCGWRWGSGWWGGNHDEYQQARMDYRMQQRDMRMQRRAARYGLPYQSRYDQLPQPQQPQYQQPQSQQQQQYPAASPQYPTSPAPTPAPVSPPAPAPTQQSGSSATPQPPVNPAG